ncbi:MAG TPA: hypothetical protein HA327_02605 [Candidatus Poseidoniaceae archaeon]|nr:MAG TPA: hypothetical protein D7H81_02590 [Candidatus Poseidoniales archaeon]HII44906.1 hypothetical protein [Candidatus Poseidoniaceae archaeon]|tara:strand:- start:2446 stop:2715 length:270 start_codon:yes stop_codon:yes gene_type:complete
MEESWDDVAWEDDGQLKEWYVEYIAVVNDQKYHHMTILYGENMEEAQRSLLHEVKRAYTSTDRIDITVVKMKQTEQDANDALFEGIFVP